MQCSQYHRFNKTNTNGNWYHLALRGLSDFLGLLQCGQRSLDARRCPFSGALNSAHSLFLANHRRHATGPPSGYTTAMTVHITASV